MVKGTQEKIINSFFKLAERYPERSSFSITEIANEAKISRQAIYQKHFKSYEEIIDFIMQSIDTTINEQFLLFEEHNLSIEVFFSKVIIPELYKYRDWLRCIYSTSAIPNWRNYLREKYSNWLLNAPINLSHSFLHNDALSNYIVNCVLSIIETWITEPFPTPPEVFSKQFIELISTPLNNHLSPIKHDGSVK